MPRFFCIQLSFEVLERRIKGCARLTYLGLKKMKRFIFVLATILCFVTAAVNAQTPVNALHLYSSASGIPGVFTNNGHSNVLYNYYDFETNETKFCIYDHDFSTVIFESNSLPDAVDLQQCVYLDFSNCEWFNYGGTDFSSIKHLYLTQNLFNSDNHFEYLSWGEGNLWHIKSTDGSTIQTIYPEEGYHWSNWSGHIPVIINLDNIFYLGLVESDEEGTQEGEKMQLYRINHIQGLTKVDVELPISVFPTMPTCDQQITVELGEGNNAKEVTVVNSLGQVIKRVPVEEGQRQITIPAQELNSGLNVVNTRTQQGQGSCKIIVR